MIKQWNDLAYWTSGEWQVIEERLTDMTLAGERFCPYRQDLFNPLDLCPFDKTKVMFMGQDPYPAIEHCSGLAFSVPTGNKTLPPTINIILDEYVNDLHHERPLGGDLTAWTKEGVLLWNAIPSCEQGKSWSHNWPEWKCLTIEIIEELRDKGIVFVLVGARAREYSSLVEGYTNCRVLHVNHPSPRAAMTAKQKASEKAFPGSRIFSRINESLVDIGLDPVDWRLSCEPRISGESSMKERKGVTLLQGGRRKKMKLKSTV